MLACFLTEAQKTVLDHLAEMHDRLLTRIWGKSQRAYEERYRELRRRAKEGLDQIVAAVEFLLDPSRSTFHSTPLDPSCTGNAAAAPSRATPAAAPHAPPRRPVSRQSPSAQKTA